ncbi:MAG: GTP-binding protein [Planctomycetota bacterium]
MSETSKTPVTLLTGFLGSGKTTLVNRILTEHHGQKIGVIVNEFGEAGIDGRLVVGSKDDVVELSNGCICCTIVGDLGATVQRLLTPGLFRERRRLDRLLIEASGLASPGPALQTLLIDPELSRRLRIDGVVALAHAALIEEQLLEHPEAGEQLAYADRVLLNHVDRAEAATIASAEAALRRCNAIAPIHRTERAALDLSLLLDTPPVAAASRPGRGESETPHTCGIGTLTLRSERPLDIHRLKMWLQFLAARRQHDLMRMKGILRCETLDTAVVAQSVYQWLELGPGDGPAPDVSTLVLIGRHLDRETIERGWRMCESEVEGGQRNP